MVHMKDTNDCQKDDIHSTKHLSIEQSHESGENSKSFYVSKMESSGAVVSATLPLGAQQTVSCPTDESHATKFLSIEQPRESGENSKSCYVSKMESSGAVVSATLPLGAQQTVSCPIDESHATKFLSIEQPRESKENSKSCYASKMESSGAVVSATLPLGAQQTVSCPTDESRATKFLSIEQPRESKENSKSCYASKMESSGAVVSATLPLGAQQTVSCPTNESHATKFLSIEQPRESKENSKSCYASKMESSGAVVSATLPLGAQQTVSWQINSVTDENRHMRSNKKLKNNANYRPPLKKRTQRLTSGQNIMSIKPRNYSTTHSPSVAKGSKWRRVSGALSLSRYHAILDSKFVLFCSCSNFITNVKAILCHYVGVVILFSSEYYKLGCIFVF